MAEPAELYSIVIVGSMNPRIHHPAWYEAVKILSAEEASAASLVACTPMASQFQLPGLNIICLQDRWEIQTQDPQESGADIGHRRPYFRYLGAHAYERLRA